MGYIVWLLSGIIGGRGEKILFSLSVSPIDHFYGWNFIDLKSWNQFFQDDRALSNIDLCMAQESVELAQDLHVEKLIDSFKVRYKDNEKCV